MKEYDKSKIELLAPCGMDCQLCYKHVDIKKPCNGCVSADINKPLHCKKCKISECVKQKDLKHCCFCVEFPCDKIKKLDSAYKKRYDYSLFEAGMHAREHGIGSLLEKHSASWSCPVCGGIVTVHEGLCSGCGNKKNNRQA